MLTSSLEAHLLPSLNQSQALGRGNAGVWLQTCPARSSRVTPSLVGGGSSRGFTAVNYSNTPPLVFVQEKEHHKTMPKFSLKDLARSPLPTPVGAAKLAMRAACGPLCRETRLTPQFEERCFASPSNFSSLHDAQRHHHSQFPKCHFLPPGGFCACREEGYRAGWARNRTLPLLPGPSMGSRL